MVTLLQRILSFSKFFVGQIFQNLFPKIKRSNAKIFITFQSSIFLSLAEGYFPGKIMACPAGYRLLVMASGHPLWPYGPGRFNGKISEINGGFPEGKTSDSLLVHIFWVNYNDLTATSLEIMASKGNHPQMALFQVSEIL
jgi:hypothetical protein